jgi:hypothetical protein
MVRRAFPAHRFGAPRAVRRRLRRGVREPGDNRLTKSKEEHQCKRGYLGFSVAPWW